MKKFVLLLLMLVPVPLCAQALTAKILVTSGENGTCSFGNINVAWVVIVRDFENDTIATRRYVSALDGCAVIPVSVPVGHHIVISGIMQDRLAVQGLSAQRLPTVTENCFNTEAFSLGLRRTDSSQLDPTDPNNVIDPKGYGMFWDQQDMQADRPGLFEVVGCPSGGCIRPVEKFNTDTGYAPNDCEVMPVVR